jgi:hypothetical protein
LQNDSGKLAGQLIPREIAKQTLVSTGVSNQQVCERFFKARIPKTNFFSKKKKIKNTVEPRQIRRSSGNRTLARTVLNVPNKGPKKATVSRWPKKKSQILSKNPQITKRAGFPQ